jgi:hypothetical protein
VHHLYGIRGELRLIVKVAQTDGVTHLMQCHALEIELSALPCCGPFVI